MKAKLCPEGIITLTPETSYEKNWLLYWHEKHHEVKVKTYTTKETAALVLELNHAMVDSDVVLFWAQEDKEEA